MAHRAVRVAVVVEEREAAWAEVVRLPAAEVAAWEVVGVAQGRALAQVQVPVSPLAVAPLLVQGQAAALVTPRAVVAVALAPVLALEALALAPAAVVQAVAVVVALVSPRAVVVAARARVWDRVALALAPAAVQAAVHAVVVAPARASAHVVAVRARV